MCVQASGITRSCAVRYVPCMQPADSRYVDVYFVFASPTEAYEPDAMGWAGRVSFVVVDIVVSGER